MNQRIAHISLVVKDYDEAIQFYTEKLNFELLEDTRNKWSGLEIRREVEYFFFCSQMISRGIMIGC